MTPEVEGLKRIPLIRKTADAADIMDMAEIEEKMGQYCQLWELYAEASCELTRKSKLSPAEELEHAWPMNGKRTQR